jgi:lysyl-tRNA synthetase class 2
VKERSRVEEDRLRKLKLLKERGINVYGGRFADVLFVSDAAAQYEEGRTDKRVRTAGRITALRTHGKASFLDLRDGTGRIQAYIRKDAVGDEAYEVFQLLDLWDIIGVEGTLGKTRTGEITVFAESFTLLSKSLTPPPEKWHGLTDVETRYRQRYVDLAANPEVMEIFRTRVRIVRLLREYLDSRGFLEVETPMMQRIAGGAAAKPFVTHHNALAMDLFLRIAPELFLKRLLVGGMNRVYELNRNFRNEGISTRHNPEFTMMEAYQAYADCGVMMQLMEEMILSVRAALGVADDMEWNGMKIRLASPWKRAKYTDLFREYVGIDAADAGALRNRALDLHIAVIKAETAAEIADDLFEELVQPHLVDPTFVTDYPVELCPLAKASPEDPRFADRFELFVGRMELGNGYTELNDPIEQERRFREQLANAKGEWAGLDEDFVHALEVGMPPAGGQGLGIDRLTMLLTGAKSIRDVILFPLLREAPPAPQSPAGSEPAPGKA